jgi:DNA-binding transcriptional ArsR family regulator
MQIRNKTKNAESNTGAELGLRAPASAAECITPIALDQLPPAALEHVANYFRTLSEPMRLRILNVLGTCELSVGEIAEQAQSSVANISRHLAQMARHGLIARSSRGNSVYYRIADPAVHDLCELVCGSIARRYDEAITERAAFAEAATLKRRASSAS